MLPSVLAVLALQATPSPPPVEWSRRPPIEYPERALSEDIRRGRVTLKCRFEQAVPMDCVVVEETPAGYGFGAAALRAVRRGVATPGVEGERTVVLNFVLG